MDYKILLDLEDLQQVILDSLYSEETNKYYSHTDMTEEERSAFTQGMVYAAIFSTSKCKKYRVKLDNYE